MKSFLSPKYEESTNNYYHFLIGYLLPIIDTIYNNTDKSIEYVVRDCGLMNTWFEKLKDFYSIQIMNSEEFLTKPSELDNITMLDYYDNQYFLSKPKTMLILKQTKQIYNIGTSDNINIGILTRNFAKTNISGFTQKNNKPRFIKNIKDLQNIINNNISNCALIDTSEDNYQSVINTYSSLKILIGQWGAGLTNMIWMQPNSTIIEITAKDKFNNNKWENCYKDLAILLGHNFISVEAQKVWDGPVDIEKILDLVKKIK